jgi:hypothetical protein
MARGFWLSGCLAGVAVVEIRALGYRPVCLRVIDPWWRR